MSSARNGHRDEALRRIAEVRQRFLDGLSARLDGLAVLAAAAGGDAGEAASHARDELRLGLHNIAGSAPTLGLAELGRRASRIERDVIDKQRDDGGLSRAVASSVADEVLRLKDTV